ncbi:MAG: zinc-dependent alcohol dehydrogenase [Microcella sp.]
MLALRWHSRGDIRIDDVPRPPSPGPGDVQLRVLWCGLCGTDVEEYVRGPVFIPADAAPIVLGHELSGEVVAVGEGVDGLRIGDVVGMDGLSGCQVCRFCVTGRVNLCDELSAVGLMRDGGLAEYVNVGAATCVPIAPGLPLEAGALAETLAVGVRAARQGGVAPGHTVAVVGGGAVGLLAAQAVRAMGASRVILIEPRADRRDVAHALGIDVVIAPDELETVADHIAIAIECSGTSAGQRTALRSLDKGGRLVLVGVGQEPLPFSAVDLIVAEIEVVGSLSHLVEEDFATAVRFIESGLVDIQPLVSHRVSLRDARDVLLRVVESPQDYLKVLVTPREELLEDIP